jgi:hypothetical protein
MTSHLRRDEPLDDLQAEIDNLGVLSLTALHEGVEDLVGQVGGRGLGQARVANLMPNRTSLKLLYFLILILTVWGKRSGTVPVLYETLPYSIFLTTI